jgi:Kef-type K+ transport system membrane component KefB
VRLLGRRRAAAAGLMLATNLTFVIVATEIGTASGEISHATGAALLVAGLLSATLFPALAVKLLPPETVSPEPIQARLSGQNSASGNREVSLRYSALVGR